uniref:ATP-dependent DNA helicase 2 subunit KU80 n=1 Tax=Lingulaulax polyedra TaxID=160621 RepID=A0A516AGE3_LINPO|nr:ATP-dependent DNA helicase 2 subunit KU80 [Lingulodinium polyedra]
MAWRAKDMTFILLDVGRTMQDAVASGEHGKVTKADMALRITRNLVQQKLLFNPKHEVGIAFFGTVGTCNALQADGYERVVVACDGKVDVPDIDTLRCLSAVPAGGEESDAVNGLIVALDLIIKRTRDQKYQKTIRVLTDSNSIASGDQDLLECVRQFEVTGTKLAVTLVATAVPGPWTPIVQASPQVEFTPLEALARSCSLCVKPVEQRAKVRLHLVIGPELSIPVAVYTHTTRVSFPTLKKRSKLAAAMPKEHQRTDNVVVERTYHLADDPDGEEVKQEDRIKGHKYGSSIVPMSEYDEAALMYTCERTLTALGFAPADSVGPESSMRQVEAVAADKGDARAYCAMESLIEAMLDERRVLIARYSFRKNAPPKMVALIPRGAGRGDRMSCLDMQYLPFTEDIREWTCASLPEPTAKHRDVVSALVDAMNLETAHVGSTTHQAGAAGATLENTDELLQPEDTHNPALTRFYRFLTQRAVDPAAKVPNPGAELRNVERPARVLERLRTAGLTNLLKGTFGLHKVEKQVKTKRFWREAIAEKRKAWDLEEVDTKRIKVEGWVKKSEKEEEEKVKDEGSQGLHGAIGAGMAAPVEPLPRVHIGSVHPERDFERWLAHRAGGIDTAVQAIEQMRDVIERLIEEDVDLHPKALSCLNTLRRGCVREGEVLAFNDFVRRLRFGETKRRAQFWERAREASLGLVTDAEVATSTVSTEEARAFLANEVYVSPQKASAPPAAATLSEMDLEAMIE